MKGEIADQAVDQKIEDKHEEEEKQRILQDVEDILGLTYLMQLHPHDMIVKVYGMAFGVGYEAAKENWSDWIDDIRDAIREQEKPW